MTSRRSYRAGPPWLAAHPAARLAGLILVAGLVLVAGCGGDDDPAEVPAGTSNVDEYVGGLPDWEAVNPVLPLDVDTTAVLPPDINWNDMTVCTTTECSIQNSPADVITFSPDSEILYLGSLIQGRTYARGLGSMLELPIRQRAPLKISVNLLTGETSRTVPNPSLTTVQQAIGELVSQAEADGFAASNDFDFVTREFYSLKQGMLGLGVSYKHLAGSVSANLDISYSTEQHTIVSYLVQKMFTTSVELPQRPSDVFSADFTQELLDEQIQLERIGPDNLPVYVSNIVWGRIAMVTMSSSYSAFEMKTALEASYGALDGNLEQQYKDVLSECNIHVMSIGGDGVQVGTLVEDIKQGRLGTFFDTDQPLTAAAPISYTLRNLADNTIAYVGDTTSYNITTCGTVEAVSYTNLDDWTQAAQQVTEGARTVTLTTTNDNMLLSHDENGNSLPYNTTNFPMGHKAIWPAAATGFAFDFTLESCDQFCPADNPNALIYEDNVNIFKWDWISIGNTDQWQNDDFRISVAPGAGTDVYAIGFVFGSNDGDSVSGEFWRACGEEGMLITSNAGVDTGNDGSSFVGYVSTVPLTCVEYDEDEGGDDVFIKNFHFGYRTRP